MDTAANKELLGRAFDEVFNQHNLDAIDQYWAADYVLHFGLNGELTGRAAARAAVQDYLTAFPDLRMDIQTLVAEDDLVVARYRLQGTHTGPWNNPIYPTPASGRKVIWTGIGIDRFANGEITEEWDEVGWIPFLQRIGGIPAPKPAPTP